MKFRTTRKRQAAIERKALRLLSDPLFLFKASQTIGELGIIGEEKNRLILFLAGISRTLREPISILVKGSTSSGKSTLVKKSILLFSPDCVIERAGLSGKALAYGKGSLAAMILFILEYRCGRDSQLLLRLLQTEGEIKHESTSIRGSRRRTQTVKRFGKPVVLTTTTDDTVFEDDETRFLSVHANERPEQTLAILEAQAAGDRAVKMHDLEVWRTATSLLTAQDRDFRNPPNWLRYVAQQLPLNHIRVRRDWNKVLTFCKAISLCRRFESDPTRALNIDFRDYCVAYRILEPVLSATMGGVYEQEVDLGNTVAALNRKLGRAVTIREVADELGWKNSLVYKHIKSAARHKVIDYEPGKREKNVKRFLATENRGQRFLPSPASVMVHCPEVGKELTYNDPLSGEWRTLRRQPVN